jgi:hypothetical protein
MTVFSRGAPVAATLRYLNHTFNEQLSPARTQTRGMARNVKTPARFAENDFTNLIITCLKRTSSVPKRAVAPG